MNAEAPSSLSTPGNGRAAGGRAPGAPAPWRVASGTARGGRHRRDRRVNQDHAQVAILDPWTVILAASDGHGGAAYPRSDRGARLATRAALEVIRIAAPDLTDPWAAPRVARALPERLHRAWLDLVEDDLERDPAPPAADGSRPATLYGATLIAALALPREVLCWQIGDGDLLVRAGGRTLSPVPADPRLGGGRTTSLCSPDAAADFRSGRIDTGSGAALVLLATDGYGDAFARSDWGEKVMADLEPQVVGAGAEDVAAALPGWLREAAEAAGDDATVCLLSRDRPGTGH